MPNSLKGNGLEPTRSWTLPSLDSTTADVRATQQLFVNATYCFLMATVLCWAGTYLHAARDFRRETAAAWAKENWPGLVLALAVTVIEGLSVEPALPVLFDEALALTTPSFAPNSGNYNTL